MSGIHIRVMRVRMANAQPIDAVLTCRIDACREAQIGGRMAGKPESKPDLDQSREAGI